MGDADAGLGGRKVLKILTVRALHPPHPNQTAVLGPNADGLHRPSIAPLRQLAIGRRVSRWRTQTTKARARTMKPEERSQFVSHGGGNVSTYFAYRSSLRPERCLAGWRVVASGSESAVRPWGVGRGGSDSEPGQIGRRSQQEDLMELSMTGGRIAYSSTSALCFRLSSSSAIKFVPAGG